MARSSATALSERITVESNLEQCQTECRIASYGEDVNYFLETYVMANKIAETDSDMMHFPQPSNNSRMEYDEALWNKVLLGNRVHYKYVLQGNFIEGFSRSISHSM